MARKELFKRGYLTSKENILIELDKYIKEFGTIMHMKDNEKGYSLFNAIIRNKLNIDTLTQELGYDLKIVRPKQTIKYKTEDDIKNILNNFIKEHGRFPTTNDLWNTLKINTHIIEKFGGIYKLKKIVGWKDENNLIDDSGWYNRSSYEYIVAQYLHHNNIPYTREQYPFPKKEGEFRSDFTLETLEGKKIHCEVWGMECLNEYSITKNKKLDLYKKYNIELISLDYSIFTQSYKRTQESLYEIFSLYFDLKYRIFKTKKLFPQLKCQMKKF